jgi:hypothetical protein
MGELQPTGETCEILEERLPGESNQLIVEICGVLGRLHSKEGLAQSNNRSKVEL